MATAEIHSATLTPGKLDLLAGWLPSQDWFDADPSDLERVAAFRLVDPGGEVGLETIIVGAGGRTFQVPLTYRGVPLADAASSLVGEMHHSVLGSRWVYDATADPVYVAEIRRVIVEADHEADLSQGDKTMTVQGSGVEGAVDTASIELVRDLDTTPHTTTALGTLNGKWTQAGAARGAILAVLRG